MQSVILRLTGSLPRSLPDGDSYYALTTAAAPISGLRVTEDAFNSRLKHRDVLRRRPGLLELDSDLDGT